ncbi:uncharacterized protein [Ptychodera flava]|uniref:uncharacterized protein n=1 Tax=Ptychodera flava TaxID=63121 RepID=UPI00396A7DDB
MTTDIKSLAVAVATGSAIALAAKQLISIMTTKKFPPPFGREMRDQEFLLDKDAAFVNHCSCGTIPRRVMERHRWFEEEAERTPDYFYRFKTIEYYEEALKTVAQFVGANPEDMAFSNNVTTAINGVLRSKKWKSGDTLLITNLTYPAVNLTCYDVCGDDLNGAKVALVKITFPIRNKEQVIDAYKAALDANPGTKLAVIDHIVSYMTYVNPVKDLVELCHSRGVEVVIDGAHAPGQLRLNVPDIGADYYAGNIYKWCLSGRCAFLWVDPKHQKDVRPVVTSNNYHKDWRQQFYYQGTRDYTVYLTAGDGLKFINDIGGLDALYGYITPLVDWAADTLTKAWSTERLQIPKDMHAPFMRIIGFPYTNRHPMTGDGSVAIMRDLWEKYKVQCLVNAEDGQFWCRLTGHVYSTKDDFYRLRDAVLDYVGDKSNRTI